MNKNQIFDLIVDKCASVCTVEAADIKSGSRQADVVDARCIAFCVAVCECGFTPRDIASLLGRKKTTNVRALMQTYDNRCKSFCFRQLCAGMHAELPAIKRLIEG